MFAVVRIEVGIRSLFCETKASQPASQKKKKKKKKKNSQKKIVVRTLLFSRR
jgi:hypothetical protein